MSTARIKGKPGTYVRLTIVRRGSRHPHAAGAGASGSRCRSSSSKLRARRRAEARRRASWPRSPRGAHGELATRDPPAPSARGARGSCSTCAPTAAGCSTRPCCLEPVRARRRRSSRPRAASARSGCSRRPATRSTRKPVVVLVDRGTASASEIVTAALHERLGAPVVGRRTFGKGVFGQVFELSNGGALDLVVGNYYTPDGREPERQGNHARTCAPRTTPTTQPDEALERALSTLPPSERAMTGAMSAARVPAASRASGCVERRGRFTVVEPFFERGRGYGRRCAGAATCGRRSGARAAVAARRPRRARGGARRSGRPDVARDVIEALLVDRGHDAASTPRWRTRRPRRHSRSPTMHARRDLTALPTFTIDPASARDFDDAISVERDGDGGAPATSTSPTSPRSCARARRSTARPSGGATASTCPARSSRCCRAALSSDACSLVPGVPRSDRDGRDLDRPRRAGRAARPSTAA